MRLLPAAVRRSTRRAALALSVCAAGLAAAPAAQAGIGDLDPTFGVAGKTTTDFGFGGYDYATATAIQSDGKIVVAGRAGGGSGDFGVARYNADGTLDTTFSGDGTQATDFGSSDASGNGDAAAGVALQSDGKIVVVGTAYATSESSDFAIVRYNADGSLDESFSGDGKQTTDIADSYDSAAGLAIQPDGKIVVAGTAYWPDENDSDIAVVRYTADGTPDSTFSGDGRQTTDVFDEEDPDFWDNDWASGVALQSDGKIVVVGSGGRPVDEFESEPELAVVRYDTDGTPDDGFSGDGIQTTDLGGDSYGYDVAVQSDGAVVALGETYTGDGGFDLALVRYTGAGALDSTFSGDGKLVVNLGGEVDSVGGLALQSDGKIVVGGGAYDEEAGSWLAVARFNSNGTPDSGFSGDGVQTTDVGAGGAAAVALQADGKIVAAGSGNGWLDFAVVRYTTGGELDAGFSGDGRQSADFRGDERASDVAVQPDDKIVVVGGQGGFWANDRFAVARYTADGDLDEDFSDDGFVTTELGADGAPEGVALQPDGKIVVVGATEEFGGEFAIARYNADGTPDSGFSGDGLQTVAIGEFGYDAIARSVAIQADGKIVVVGEGNGDGEDDYQSFAVVRLNANGTPDNGFSGDGRMTTDFNGGEDRADDVAIQPDGKIVAIGTGGPNDNFALVRLNTNGTLDASFSGDGKQTTDIGQYDAARSVALQADGKIVVAGGTFSFVTPIFLSMTLVRYTAGGVPDPSFDGDGIKTIQQFGGDRAPGGLLVQPDGKILVAAGPSFALARLTSNGELDGGFAGDGKQTTDFGQLADAVGLGLQSDGKVVVGGTTLSTGESGFDFALARFENSSGPPVVVAPPDDDDPVVQPPPGGAGTKPTTPTPPTKAAEPSAACKRARKARRTAQRTIKSARKKLSKATRPAAKRKWRAKVKRSKLALQRANKRVGRACG
jgi:uncharacterized delta-60 repeat protein